MRPQRFAKTRCQKGGEVTSFDSGAIFVNAVSSDLNAGMWQNCHSRILLSNT